MQYMKEHGGFSLTEFHSWGNWSHDPKFNAGEYSIYTLPDFSSCDGIIADLTCIQDTDVRTRIAQMITESGVPAVTLCNREMGLTCVRSDNYSAVCRLFDHLWDVHGCRTFFFAGSSSKTSESMERESAFIDSCSRHKVPITGDMILERDFSVSTGIQAVRQFFLADSTAARGNIDGNESSAGSKRIDSSASIDTSTGSSDSIDDGKDKPVRPIPDAFVCANDNIAIGVIMEMKKHGYLCPRDFRVTGFDNLDKAMYYQPQITTVTLDREAIAYHAMEILDRMINGEKVPENVHTPARIVYAESCGCPTSREVDYRAYLAWQVEDSIYVDERNERYSTMVSALDPSLSLSDLTERVADRYAAADLDGAYVVLDDRIGSGSLEEGRYDPDHLTMITARERAGQKPETSNEPKASDESEASNEPQALNEPEASNEPQALNEPEASNEPDMQPVHLKNIYALRDHLAPVMEGSYTLVLPLHIRSFAAGLVILRNPRFIIREWRFYEFQDIVLHALTEWDTNRKLMNSLSTLREVYYRDLLTGLYSKNAFKPRFLPWLSGELEKGRSVAIFFLDIDGFKEINDTRGHAYGDHILQVTASDILHAVPPDNFTYRYGGDEFVVILSYQQKESVRDSHDRILRFLARDQITASIGTSYPVLDCPPDELLPRIEKYIHDADKDMYRCKKIHHATR